MTIGIHSSEPNQDCVVGGAIQRVLETVYGRLDDVLRDELARTTVEDVLVGILPDG